MRSTKRYRTVLIISTIFIVMYVVFTKVSNETIASDLNIDIANWRNLSEKEMINLSNLGRIMFLNEPVQSIEENSSYKILMWKYGKTIESRHLKHYGKEFIDPFEHCSVDNCNITYDDEDIKDADIVIFHMHRMKGIQDLPKIERDPNQIWAFLTDESPFNVFLNKRLNKIKDYNNIFNWSMNYRLSSDIPVPYGRTVPLSKPDETKVDDVKLWKKSKKNYPKIAIMGSNCGSTNKRWEYVNELKKYIDVDMYGGCGTLKCEGHFKSDCPKLNDYMFYLAFENSNCQEYITEKVWWNAYGKNAIPIVMGTSESYLSKHLPPHSYINVEKYPYPKDLAKYVDHLTSNNDALQQYFQWKKYFEVRQEHGYFKSESFHYCRVCEALNYNSRISKVHDHLESTWTSKFCYPNWQSAQ